MRVLPARRLASSALCAALLVGIAGPAATAADLGRERGHAASPDARPPTAGTLRDQVRKPDAAGDALTPVADLLNTALRTDGGRPPAAEVRKLGDAAKRALADAVEKAEAAETTEAARKAEAPAAPAVPKASHTAPERRAADATDDTLDTVQRDIDNLVEAIIADDIDQVLAYVDDLLADVLDFVTAVLADSALWEAAMSIDPAAADISTSTLEDELPAVTFPAIDLPALVFLPEP